MVGGRGVVLAGESCVRQAELFLCLDLDSKGREALVRQASAVEAAWLPPDRLDLFLEGQGEHRHLRFQATGERSSALLAALSGQIPHLGSSRSAPGPQDLSPEV